jgi:hypothetical protein
VEDISATGLSLTIIASVTYPNGFTVTEFADDADPLDFPAIDIATASMNVNGDLVVYSSPVPLNSTINVIPGSAADNNLSIIYEANRAAKGKTVARDVITMIVNYPDGTTATASNGKMVNGIPGKGVASAGRLKTPSYGFSFQDFQKTRRQGL